MAITSIWSVKGWLGKVLIYTENPAKTENPAYYEKQGMTTAQTQGLADVIDYAAQTHKTQFSDESAGILKHYVTGVNCAPETARDEMMAVKRRFGKEEGVVAYHGIQSFSPDDVQAGLTPDMAHEIGVKLAQRLWGDTHQVVVATHLDTANHLHSHFVVNTVSWVDGIRYHRTNYDYYRMRAESDRLCREYGLSVIDRPHRGRSKHYGEWKAEREGKPTYRGMVKAEIDEAIRASMTERQLWDNLCKRGWRITFGKDITVRPPGKDRGLKLYRNFGDDYSVRAIRDRILANTRPQRYVIHPDGSPKRSHPTKGTRKRKKTRGLRALYFYYQYRMGVLPKRRKQNPNSVYFLYREDIRFIQKISREARLLAKHGIDTDTQLATHTKHLTRRIISLCVARKQLRSKVRSIHDEDRAAPIKTEIATLSAKISDLRKEVRLCEDIKVRSETMEAKINRAEREQEKTNRKELNNHELHRRRG